MKKLFLIFAFFSASAFAQNSWFDYTESDNWKYQVKTGSFENTKDGGSILLRTMHKTNQTTHFYVASMKTIDCKKGIGKTTWRKLNGEIYKEYDFVSDGGNIASYIGDGICSLILDTKSV
jgi:hypothetical protein